MADDLKYKGANQPAVSSGGWLSRFGNLLGGSGGASAYQGDGQPAPRTTGLLGTTAPVYRQEPSTPTAREPALIVECPPAEAPTAQIAMPCPERDPYASLPVAILVPRQR